MKNIINSYAIGLGFSVLATVVGAGILFMFFSLVESTTSIAVREPENLFRSVSTWLMVAIITVCTAIVVHELLSDIGKSNYLWYWPIVSTVFWMAISALLTDELSLTDHLYAGVMALLSVVVLRWNAVRKKHLNKA